MRSILASTSVRLAAGYAALFAFSSLLMIGFIWWRTTVYLDRQTDAQITREAREIKDELQDFGLRGAVKAVDQRAADPADRHLVLLLADAGRRALAGNLTNWPPQVSPKPGWLSTDLDRNGERRAVRLLRVALPGGVELLAGRDVEERAEIRALVLDSLGWAGASAALLGIGGIVMLRRAVLRRIKMIDDAAAAILRGELSRRVPAQDSTEAFDHLAQTVNAMLQQIQQLIEGVRNTTNAIAHDLRTPLTELRARLEELAANRPASEMTFEEIHKAVTDIDRVIGIFNALLRLSEIDSGLRRAGFRRVDLAALATEVAELYGPLVEEKGAAFVVDVEDGLAVNGDPHLLAQAVANLVDNAAKYLPRGGEVALRIGRAEDRRIEITVADNGPGIAKAELPRVTRRFYRCGGADVQPGAGLGLSVVDAVARLHDGALSFADNHPGLVATIALPQAAVRAIEIQKARLAVHA
jgi:signal transduction histidine kinase